MAFLTLNGWAVPVARGGERAPVVIGEEGRAFDGTLMSDRRVIKDSWRFETKGLAAEDATALVGMLMGRGDTWPYDADLYSGKGLGPPAATDDAYLRPGISLYPVGVILDKNDRPETKFGAGALTQEDRPTNNLVTQSQSQCSSTAGFAVIAGGALATSTTYKAIDTGEAVQTSVRHTRTALGQGLHLSPEATLGFPGNTAFGLVYVMSGAAATVDVSLTDDLTGEIAAVSKALSANAWYCIELAGTTAGGAVTADLEITVTAGPVAGVIYIDGVQILNPDGGLAAGASWAEGGTAPVRGNLEYSAGFLDGASGITFAAWCLMPATSFASNRHLFSVCWADGSSVQLLRAGAENVPRVYTSSATGSGSLVSGTAPWAAEAWRHIAVTLGRDERTGVAFRRLYIDGVLDCSDVPANVPNTISPTVLGIGCFDASTSIMGIGSRLDDVIVLPYALPPAVIALYAAKTAAITPLPKLLAAGDAIQGLSGSALVEGKVPSRGYSPRHLAGTWHDNAQVVAFELET